jgi:CIC family chloride channel protein
MRSLVDRLTGRRARRALRSFIPDAASSVDLTIVGRTLLHAALVGAAAGLVGAAFFAGLEYVQRLLLEDLGGYHPLRAAGENFLGESTRQHVFRPWLLVLLPAVGALGSGIVSQLAPETRGGGGDAMIDAYHHHGGMIRPRVIWVKALASLLTLGSGGAGGREGPTMLIGGALGSTVGRLLRVRPSERRILMIAGVAAGIAAVFRTPLGAALLAVEVLYHDDFESDALIPAVLASVVAYSVVISIYGEATLFSQPSRFPFVPAHLWLYGLMAVVVAVLATVFLRTLRTVQSITARLSVPPWAKPAVGGLALGVFAVPLAGLCLAKLFASSLTIGTGGSAGDFAPSLVIGGLFGGAFGRAVQLLSNDPRINPAAFALVAMGTFYGGLAHTPLSSLIIVCELAGSYDLLVPLMLAEGIAFIALRKRSLYHAQLPSRRTAQHHRDDPRVPPALVATGPPAATAPVTATPPPTTAPSPSDPPAE